MDLHGAGNCAGDGRGTNCSGNDGSRGIVHDNGRSIVVDYGVLLDKSTNVHRVVDDVESRSDFHSSAAGSRQD